MSVFSSNVAVTVETKTKQIFDTAIKTANKKAASTSGSSLDYNSIDTASCRLSCEHLIELVQQAQDQYENKQHFRSQFTTDQPEDFGIQLEEPSITITKVWLKITRECKSHFNRLVIFKVVAEIIGVAEKDAEKDKYIKLVDEIFKMFPNWEKL